MDLQVTVVDAGEGPGRPEGPSKNDFETASPSPPPAPATYLKVRICH